MANHWPFLTESSFSWSGKKVLLRFDGDVPVGGQGNRAVVLDDYRLQALLPTLHFLQDRGVAQIILLAHRGRPHGRPDAQLSLRPVADWLHQELGQCHFLSWTEKPGREFLQLYENIRFQPEEEKNDRQFAQSLAKLADVLVNDAFASSHRREASIVGLPQFLPTFLGLRFEAEVRTLTWLRRQAKRPRVFLLGGKKADKLEYLDFLAGWADQVLLGGALPTLLKRPVPENVLVAELTDNDQDIAPTSRQLFAKKIKAAATFLWAGPVGAYEKEENQAGMAAIIAGLRQSQGFKVAAGGDTHQALLLLGATHDFNFISVGGGAFLQFLRDQTLPGMENGARN